MLRAQIVSKLRVQVQAEGVPRERAKLRVVEGVECLGSELQVEPFCRLGIFEQGQITVVRDCATQDVDPGIAERSCCWLRESIAVKCPRGVDWIRGMEITYQVGAGQLADRWRADRSTAVILNGYPV